MIKNRRCSVVYSRDLARACLCSCEQAKKGGNGVSFTVSLRGQLLTGPETVLEGAKFQS
jgi:hypothetical protein